MNPRINTFLLPILVAAAMGDMPKAPKTDRIEAKEPVKSHGGAGRNIHKGKKKGRKKPYSRK